MSTPAAALNAPRIRNALRGCYGDSAETAATSSTSPRTSRARRRCSPIWPKRSAGADSTTVRTLIAENPACPVDALEVLSRDERSEVRLRAARHNAAPAAVLQRLAHDPDVWVRCEIANNPLCDPRTLQQMSNDTEAVVRSLVATNRHAPPVPERNSCTTSKTMWPATQPQPQGSSPGADTPPSQLGGRNHRWSLPALVHRIAIPADD